MICAAALKVLGRGENSEELNSAYAPAQCCVLVYCTLQRMKCPMSSLPFSCKPRFEVRQRHPALSCLDAQDVFITLTPCPSTHKGLLSLRREMCFLHAEKHCELNCPSEQPTSRHWSREMEVNQKQAGRNLGLQSAAALLFTAVKKL